METTFNITDAEVLKQQMQCAQETLKDDWANTLSAWQNLIATWDDAQYNKFEDHFQQIITHYQTITQSLKKSTQQLSEQIEIAQRQHDRLNELNR